MAKDVTKEQETNEELLTNAAEWTNTETSNEALANNLESRLNKSWNSNPDLSYFLWEESVIEKLSAIKPDLDFNDLKWEWIRLKLFINTDKKEKTKVETDDSNGNKDKSNINKESLTYLKQVSYKISPTIQTAVIHEIFEQVKTKIWDQPPYEDFSRRLAILTNNLQIWDYIYVLIRYLESKEKLWWKKTADILDDIFIANEDINNRLPKELKIPTAVKLSDPTIPNESKEWLDYLLSFEIGKDISSIEKTSEDITNKFKSLFSNTIPAINAFVWENPDYKYDEKKFWKEFEDALAEIENNESLKDRDVEKYHKITSLRWEYYINYLKKENEAVWNMLEQLYNNNFDYRKLDQNTLQTYLNNVVEERLSPKWLQWIWLDNYIKSNWCDKEEFKRFYLSLINLSDNSINLDPKREWLKIPVKKILSKWSAWLQDLDEYGKNVNSSRDSLPIEYEIKKSDIEALPINEEDKKNLLNLLSQVKKVNENDNSSKQNDESYIIQWSDFGKLIHLFFVFNGIEQISSTNPETTKEVENLLSEWEKDKAENAEQGTNKKENIENFKNEIEKLWDWVKFENGVEVRMPIWNSQLPWWWYQRMKVKIYDIDEEKWTFNGKVFGWELKFNSKIEWKSKTFNMDLNTIESFKKISKDSSKIRLLPNPDKTDFNSFQRILNGKTGDAILKFPGWVTWDKNKFVYDYQNKTQEVNCFSTTWDDKSSYKIKYNPHKRTFSVSSLYNWNETWKNWKTEMKRFSYQRDMDWNNFLIFFSQKWLKPQNEEEYKETLEKQDNEFRKVKIRNWWWWKLYWFSISNIKNVIKWEVWKIKKQLDDYNKGQESKLEDILVWDWWIYNKLANVLGFIPSMKEALWNLQQEYYDERDNRNRKQIEKYLKIFQSDPDFGTTFDKVPPFAKILWWKSYREFILWEFRKSQNLWEDKKASWKAAALLLANIEKWWSPYRWLSEFENQWLWVKVLLWKDHYNNFLADKEMLTKKRDLAETTKNSWLDKKSLNNQLATCEMDYIINNIRGWFWCNEERWIKGEKPTEYIDNPAKWLLSDQFANKLESMKWWFSKASVEESYTKYKSNISSFEKAEDEFNKMWSSRYQKGAAALRIMLDYTSDASLKRRAQKCFLLYLLCWALDIYCDASLKKQVYSWAKPMSFVPWLLVKERNVAENVATLLDDATNGDFSKNVSKYFHKEYLSQGKPVDYAGLKEQINKWLTTDKMDMIEKYFSELPTKDFSSQTNPEKKKILEKFRDSLLKEDREEQDRNLFDQPALVNNWLLTNVDVISNRLMIKDWDFDWKDSDDINNKRDFWKEVTKDIDRKIQEKSYLKPEIVNFVLDRYFSRFWIRSSDERQDIYKRINTAYYYKHKVSEYGWIYDEWTHNYKKDNEEEIHIPIWVIRKEDVDKVLLYGLEWNIWTRCSQLRGQSLPPELKEALDKFQEFFTAAFDNDKETLNSKEVKSWAFKAWDLWENDRFLLWGWDQYKKIKGKDNDSPSDTWDDISVWNNLPGPKKREYLRNIFKVEDYYINEDMETIYNTLKRNNPVTNTKRSLWISGGDRQLSEIQTDKKEKQINELREQLNK